MDPERRRLLQRVQQEAEGLNPFTEPARPLFGRQAARPADLDTVPYCQPAGMLIRYRIERELLAGDIVEVKSVLLEIRDRSLRFRHEMRNAETGEIAAVCEFTGVHMDRQSRKSTAFVDTIRRTAAKLLAFPEPADA